MKHHNQWTSKIGFILATAGAAIGLGNLWKFPYLMGRNGGFPFLVAYLFFIVILGVPVMITEMSLGRKTRHNPVRAYQDIHPRAKEVGIFGVLAAFLILSYYSVIGGWILKYFFSYLTTLQAPADFNAFIGGSWEPIIWFGIFMVLTVGICLYGIKGIEKASTFMMPMLFILLIIIIVRSVTLPGASEGLLFIFKPNMESFHLESINAALGQVFYSLSLCMGITVTYGSYLNKKENIPNSCIKVAVLDTMVAVLAGIAIFPAVFAFGLEPGQGPGLIFGTLPKVFSSIKGGAFFAIIFFMLIFLAALTSAIALLEVSVSYALERWKFGRKKTVIVTGILIFLIGIPSTLSFGVLGDVTILNYSVFDFIGMITDNILLPIGGLLMCYYIGWKWSPKYLVEEIEQEGIIFKWKKIWIFCVKFIAPILVLIVTISGFINVYKTIFS